MVQAIDYIAGICGGVAVVLTGHPFDTTKIRLQTAPDGFYKDTLDCVRTTFKKDGLRGFYAGITSPLIGQIVFRSASFGTFHHTVGILEKQGGEGDSNSKYLNIMISGSVTGAIISFIESPIDLVKTKLQIQVFNSENTKPLYNGLYSCTKHMIKADGVKAMYQGLSGTIIRNIPANALFFPVNEIVKCKLSEYEGVSIKHLSVSSRLLAGACAGLGYWATTYPLDIVKSTMQSMNHADRLGWVDTVKYIYSNGGIKSFFRGFTPCVLRAVPACAAMFSTVDFVREYLHDAGY